MKTETDERHENLSQKPAVDKIREMAKGARICMFGTTPSDQPLQVRPMAVQEVDDQGNLWFLSGRDSTKNRQIQQDPAVQLLFSNVGDSEYLCLNGTATISDDRQLREKYWSSMAKTWFNGGVDDPDLTVVKVHPVSGYYWDTQHGKAVSMMKIAVGAVTGKTIDDSIEGKVRV